MGLLDRIGRDVRADGEPLATSGRPTTLVEIGERVQRGEAVAFAMRDFLDQVERLSAEELAALVEHEPAPTGDARAEALLGGIAEWTAVTRGFACPGWALAPGRFLDRFWFVSETSGPRDLDSSDADLAEAPRRFWPARSLRRV